MVVKVNENWWWKCHKYICIIVKCYENVLCFIINELQRGAGLYFL